MTTTVTTLSETQPTAPVRLVMNEQSFENKVFVGNLSFKTTKESLTAFAEKSGKM
jgi:RNA recognition motif-containing protein